jgi:hypothetical protein
MNPSWLESFVLRKKHWGVTALFIFALACKYRSMAAFILLAYFPKIQVGL